MLWQNNGDNMTGIEEINAAIEKAEAVGVYDVVGFVPATDNVALICKYDGANCVVTVDNDGFVESKE